MSGDDNNDTEHTLSDSGQDRYDLQDIPSAGPFIPNLPLPAGIDREEEVQAELGM